MKVYRGITEKHVNDAIQEFILKGYPKANESRRWDLISNTGQPLPPKLVLQGAAKKAGVPEAIKNRGGGWPTNDILELLGCVIAKKTGYISTNRPPSILSDEDLLKLARSKGTKTPKISTTQTTTRERHWAIAEYVKRKAGGTCDLCREPAPFLVDGAPFLECHHVVHLANGGADEIENAVALCPNCHRKMHLIADNSDKQSLLNRISSRD